MPSGTRTVSIGSSLDFDGVTVTFREVYWLENSELFARLENAIGIEVELQNRRNERVSYSPILSWGDILTSTGDQLNSVIYITLNDETRTFSGSSILPGARIVDTLTFERFDGEPSSFVFHGNPPFEGGAEFKLSFHRSEIVTR